MSDVTYPIQLSRDGSVKQKPRAWTVLLSSASSYYPLDAAWVGLGYVTDTGQAMPAPNVASGLAQLRNSAWLVNPGKPAKARHYFPEPG